jgi:PleD family two-component response regulator
LNTIKNTKPIVLIVDDDKSNIDLILNILPDYDCIPCLNGQTALKIIKEEKINLILLDIVMPNMNGFEVCSIIKLTPEYKNIPIIFLSSNTNIESINQGFSLGAVDYLVKPFNPIELLCRIQTHLKLQSYQKSIENKNIELQKLNQKIKDIAKKDIAKIYKNCDFLIDDDINFNDYLEDVTLDED